MLLREKYCFIFLVRDFRSVSEEEESGVVVLDGVRERDGGQQDAKPMLM